MIEIKAVEFLNDVAPERLITSAPPGVEVLTIGVVVTDETLAALTSPSPPKGVKVYSQNVMLSADRETNIAALCARTNPNAIGVIKLIANCHERMTAEVEPATVYATNKGIRWYLNSVIQGAIEMANLRITHQTLSAYGTIDCTYKYETPITSPAHAAFCRAEAERQYDGTLVRDCSGMLIVEQENGVRHTDDVLRALSVYCEPRVS